jgi:DNA-binding protein YbaB
MLRAQPTERNVVGADDQPTTGPAKAVLEQLSALRGTGTAADELVRASVDGTGTITDLVIEPRAMRLTSVDLACEIRTAISAARQDAEAQLTETSPGPAAPDVAALQQLLTDVDTAARQRLDQFVRFADELSARLGRS